MTTKEFLGRLFEDVDGSPSSKRVFGAWFAVLMTVSYVAANFWGKLVPEFMFNTVSYIVIASLIGATVEHFAPKSITGSPNEPDSEK